MEQLEQQAFARPVRTHDHGAAFRLQVEAHSVEYRCLAETQFQVTYRERQDRRGPGAGHNVIG
ncbi:hypothetical protein [Roseovarius confluentis]|uniref:hypothetical protein n=1 Tax=Roseovarius confluentis TaxID=1852027 RepID=UPI003C7A2342